MILIARFRISIEFLLTNLFSLSGRSFFFTIARGRLNWSSRFHAAPDNLAGDNYLVLYKYCTGVVKQWEKLP